MQATLFQDPTLQIVLELCARMRETGRTSCTILFCESYVFIEADEPKTGEIGLGVRRSA